MASRTRSELRHPDNSFPVGARVHILDEPYPSQAVTHGTVTKREGSYADVEDEHGVKRAFKWSSDKIWTCRCADEAHG